MDIVKKIKPLKATHESLNWFYKISAAIVVVALFSTVFPQKTFAVENDIPAAAIMVFETGDHTQFISEIEEGALFDYKHETTVEKLRRQLRMNDALQAYLKSKGSPLAPYSATILQQNNWKKIIALSNAESSLCKRYPVDLANCWGVGGSNMWDMGDNLGEGVAAMNKFLNTAPSRAKIKYSQMNFDQMNGLYKQPAGDHWVYNNLEIYNELTALEKNLQ